MARMNWERAAKQDYIARHGATPYGPGYTRGNDDRLEAAEVDLRVRLQKRSMMLLDEFAELQDFERMRLYEVYFKRLAPSSTVSAADFSSRPDSRRP